MESIVNLCRLCMVDASTGVELFNKRLGEQYTYSEVIMSTFQIQLQPNNDFPTRVCQECSDLVERAHLFRKEILLSQIHFLQFKKPSKIDPETVEEHLPRVEQSSDHETVEIIIMESELNNNDDDEEEEVIVPVTKTTQRKSKSYRATRSSVDKRMVDREEVCQFCDRIFRSKGLLVLHQSHLHKNDALSGQERTLKCDVCGKGFAGRSNLTLHSKIHRERRTEQCPTCGKYCVELKRHLKIHREGQRKACPECGKETTSLRGHMKTHREKRFKCDVCDKAFVNPHALQRHRHVHTKDKVKCPFCPHQATHESNSRSHMRLKHPKEYEQLKAQNQRKYTEPRIVVPKEVEVVQEG